MKIGEENFDIHPKWTLLHLHLEKGVSYSHSIIHIATFDTFLVSSFFDEINVKSLMKERERIKKTCQDTQACRNQHNSLILPSLI